jgi:hypothetical protein
LYRSDPPRHPENAPRRPREVHAGPSRHGFQQAAREDLIAYGFTPMMFDLSTAGSMHSDATHPCGRVLEGIRIFYDVISGEF